ncbi:glucose 1-dehydrogenase [Sulfobacillus harzensis]|uniref:SDR family oxidoreductase n=1 Tax=Sulfobacillus harzensis TaxID=2729629 RepID=A0A7Y0L3I5_9FIRM|nr:SDR family oxidoreductase [Sulfobacillus harzensis]
MNCRDQVVLVTGAASGIGFAVASAYAREGARVAMVDLRREAVTEAAQRIFDQDLVYPVQADVRLVEEIERALDGVGSRFGTPTILVNAAGLYPSDPVLEMSEVAWDRVLDTNLKGPFFTSQSFARRLIRQNVKGNIVNITSGAAKRARPGAAHYSASKAGLAMLTQALAIELAPFGIRVNAVSPGFVEVHSAVNQLSTRYVEAIRRTIPLGRAGAPEDIAHAVLFLTGPGSDWITGTVFRVDGGSAAGTTALPLSRVDQEEGGDNDPQAL